MGTWNRPYCQPFSWRGTVLATGIDTPVRAPLAGAGPLGTAVHVQQPPTAARLRHLQLVCKQRSQHTAQQVSSMLCACWRIAWSIGVAAQQRVGALTCRQFGCRGQRFLSCPCVYDSSHAPHVHACRQGAGVLRQEDAEEEGRRQGISSPRCLGIRQALCKIPSLNHCLMCPLPVFSMCSGACSGQQADSACAGAAQRMPTSSAWRSVIRHKLGVQLMQLAAERLSIMTRTGSCGRHAVACMVLRLSALCHAALHVLKGQVQGSIQLNFSAIAAEGDANQNSMNLCCHMCLLICCLCSLLPLGVLVDYDIRSSGPPPAPLRHCSLYTDIAVTCSHVPVTFSPQNGQLSKSGHNTCYACTPCSPHTSSRFLAAYTQWLNASLASIPSPGLLELSNP